VSEEDRARTFAQRRHADLGTRLAVEKAPLQRRQHEIFTAQLPGAVRLATRIQNEERRTAAELPGKLARLRLCQRG